METENMNTAVETLSPELLKKMNAYWRAANYLSVGQIYLYDNPLLKEPLKLEHVKPLVVGHNTGPEFYLCASQSRH
jgi:xylulose-5-phosphate/fructose-6-phosphate phosphoketolase